MSPESHSSRYHGLSLEEELEQVEDAPNLNLENSRLKAEIKILQNTQVNSKATQLSIDLAESERARRHLEERYQELFEKHTAEQKMSNNISSNSLSENNDTMDTTRRLYIEASQELTATKAKLSQLQSKSSARDRELSEKNQLVATLRSNMSPPDSLPNSEAKTFPEEGYNNKLMEHDLQKQDCQAENYSLIRNLSRENALLTTAWYGITMEIQSNYVVMQRRTEKPKNWLSEQRQLVSAVGKR